MKAYRLYNFTGLEDLGLEEEVLGLQRGEALIRVHAVSLNFRDIAMLHGRYPVPHRKGLILTSDGVGEVLEVGEGVDDFKIGDRVLRSGTVRSRAQDLIINDRSDLSCDVQERMAKDRCPTVSYMSGGRDTWAIPISSYMIRTTTTSPEAIGGRCGRRHSPASITISPTLSEPPR